MSTSAIEDLAALQNGPDGAAAAAAALTAMWTLPDTQRVVGAQWFGAGGRASVLVRLADGTEMDFESLRDVMTPKALKLEIVATTGATPKLTEAQAVQSVSLLRDLAVRQAAESARDLAEERALAFVQEAQVLDVDMLDGAERWGAFLRLAGHADPALEARHKGISIARASLVLRDLQGVRYVRCAWFAKYVRGEDASLSPTRIAALADQVGWHRRGGDPKKSRAAQGRIKATRPGFREHLAFSLYEVAAGWENDR